MRSSLQPTSNQPTNKNSWTFRCFGNISGLISPVFLMVLTKIKQLILRCSCLTKLSFPWEEKTLSLPPSAHKYISMAFPGKLQLSNTWSRKKKKKQKSIASKSVLHLHAFYLDRSLFLFHMYKRAICMCVNSSVCLQVHIHVGDSC